MKAGEKVICIEAGRNKECPEYNSPLIRGNVYVVKAVIKTPGGKMGLQLIGVSLPPVWSHQSFCPSRFRRLAEMKSALVESGRQLQCLA